MFKGIKIFLLLAFAAGILASGNTAVADEEGRSIKEVMAEIRQKQNLQADQNINCDMVTDDQYRELGEAWMDVMIPDPAQHRMMDRMMGGPGSQSLADAHKLMGMRYLGCISDETYYGTMPGMTKGYYGMGNMMYGYNGGWMHAWGGGLIMWIVLLAVIGLVVYLIVAATRSGHGTTNTVHHISPGESAHDILKKRYAKGEISKEEFEQMKKDIS